jgi:outer membrane protein TolC
MLSGCVALLGAFAVGPRAETAAVPAEPEPLVAAEAFHTTDAQLAELIASLLADNPELQAARATVRSERARVPQQQSLPDPQLAYRWFAETPETRVGPQRHGIEVSQGLPWAGKRSRQTQRARHVVAGVAWAVRNLERELVAELKRAYFEAAYAQEALAVNADETALLRRFEQIALTRYSTGAGIQQSVIRVQTALSRLAARRTALGEQLERHARRIARLTGATMRGLELRPIVLTLPEVDHDRQALDAGSLQEHPALRAAQQGILADREWVRRRELERRPDFRVGLGFVEVGDRDDRAAALNPPSDDGQDVWAVSVGLNLPIHRKRIRAGIAEAQESLSARQQRLEHARDGLRLGVQESILRVESAVKRAQLYRDVIVPQAEESLASAEAAYTTNRLDFLDLLDAERVLFEVRLTLHRLLADCWIALADLEEDLGRRYPAEGGAS